MKKYKVLSVRQPYASLLVSGVKDVENRSRRTNFRGMVLIHASAKMHEIMNQLPTKIWLLGANPAEQHVIKMAKDVVKEDLFGCIIGSVYIVDCVQNHPSEWTEKGQWHWVCSNCRKLKHPIPAKGMLGLWDWEGDIKEEDYE